MANSYFQFKQFMVHQDRCAMKVTTDGCLFGAWVAEQVKSENKEVTKLLDIGAGTGLLSLMVAQANSAIKLDAIEIDKDAFEQAKENIANSPWNSRISVFHGDAKEFSSPYLYDVIISNPPFYEKELKSENSKKNKAHHDEGLLLDDLLSIIKKNLAPGGEFYLLLPYKRKEAIDIAFAKNELAISHITFVRQSTQHHYFRIMISGKYPANKEGLSTTTELTIRNEKQEYMPEFIQLLKNYYLHL
ncbi:tRNA1(Val) (adenine(37)-N6)-methyltransferase [Terrimonas pollutisoli]|uniref:tRNA1(Val) (adenine(37)-N6)-methyltransferase n=1 Tax=Terrimonas pollutisoli TaxID=3034147 RepID=UPI0023EC2B11|nr:methyltransferase [Terrimonas sp. H1YJ31]